MEQLLRGEALAAFLPQMYGDTPSCWSEALTGTERLRFIVNVLTRTRFVATDGTLELHTKDGAAAAPVGFHPWFEVPGRRTLGTPIAFGHWATLGLIDRPDLLALDTGCVWGRQLSAMRVDGGRRELVQVECT